METMDMDEVDFSQTNGLTAADFFEVCRIACGKSKRFSDFFFSQLIREAGNQPTDESRIWRVRVLIQTWLPMETRSARRAWNQAVTERQAAEDKS